MDANLHDRPIRFVSESDGTLMPADDKIAMDVTSGHQTTAMIGRAIAAGIPERITSWAEAELRSGIDPSIVFATLLDMQLQLAASIAGNLFTEAADQPIADGWARIIQTRFAEHAQSVRRARRLHDENTEQAG